MDTKGEVGNKLGWEKHIHTAIYKTDKQGRTFVQHREFCNNLYGKRTE